jgi:3-hydroxyisobutyrate dehydrogenase
MALGIEMIAVSEALGLGEKLGLDAKLLTEIMSVSSSRCWSLDTYNPVPGVMECLPSSKDYAGGFACELILKDLGIAKEVAGKAGASTPLGKHTLKIY